MESIHMLTATLNFYVKFTFYQPATVKNMTHQQKKVVFRFTANEKRNSPAPSTCNSRGAMDQRVGLLIQRSWVRVRLGLEFFLFKKHSKYLLQVNPYFSRQVLMYVTSNFLELRNPKSLKLFCNLINPHVNSYFKFLCKFTFYQPGTVKNLRQQE